MCAHCTWCNILRGFFFFCYSQVWERFDQDEAPSPSQADQIHLRTEAATISLQESLYPLLTTMLSVYWQVPRQQPSRTPAPLWKRKTAPAELWVASNVSVARKTQKNLTRWVLRTLNSFKKMLIVSLMIPVPHSSHENCSNNTEILCEGGKPTPRRSSPVAHGDDTRLVIKERPNMFKKARCYT